MNPASGQGPVKGQIKDHAIPAWGQRPISAKLRGVASGLLVIQPERRSLLS
jgi:hypothetical protein